METLFTDPVEVLKQVEVEGNGRRGAVWLAETIIWIAAVPPSLRAARLKTLTERICEDAAAMDRFLQIWTCANPARIFSEAGLPEATSLPKEFIARLKKRMLPQFEDNADLYTALQTVCWHPDDALWVAQLPSSDGALWSSLIPQLEAAYIAAIRILAVRVASIALSRNVITLGRDRREAESLFLSLIQAATELSGSEKETASELLREIGLQCRIWLVQAHLSMEERGVSADLVFRLDLALAQLERIQALLDVLEGRITGAAFASMIVGAVADERGLHSLVRRSVDRVARHVVAHTGKSGEHYVASTHQEWLTMGKGAVGAGVLTAFTALLKYMLSHLFVAPLWIGIAHSLNYALSFIVMQVLGWNLASKMPSMTAAALCVALEKQDGMKSEVNLVAAITRTQMIVTIGNLAGAIPTAIVIDLVIRFLTGHAFLDNEAAMHGVQSMHLLESPTVSFAALTGVFLWLSSLVAGWTANWIVLNRLPAAIAQSRRMQDTFGELRAQKIANAIAHHFSGAVGYVCLGLLLGLVPFISAFSGFPIEVRHITLASASLTYDLSSLAGTGHIPWIATIWAVFGLAATGVLNFVVSFTLGLWLAFRACRIDTSGRKALVVALGERFRRSPSTFLWSDKAVSQDTSADS